MKQGTLPIWEADNLITYTEAKVILEFQYSRRGPKLVKRALELLETCEEAFALHLFSELNDIALELSALNPAGWADFSTVVFIRNLLCQNGLYTQKPMTDLRETFLNTMRSLANE